MTDAEILAEAKKKMAASAKPIVTLDDNDFTAVQSSGTSLRTAKAKDLKNGIYSILELKDVVKKTKSEVIDSLTEFYGEEPKWASNLPETNISGYARLKIGDAGLGVYLNNALFNLMVEQGALNRNESNGEVTLTGKTFKI